MKRVKIRFNSAAAIGKVLRFDDNIDFLTLLRMIVKKLLGDNLQNGDLGQFRLMLGNDVEVDDAGDC